MLNDTLNNALTATLNAENVGKPTVNLKPVSKIIEHVLTLLNEAGYVGSYEKQEAVGGPFITLNLLGKINKCGSIKPRRNIQADEVEKAEKRYLPARDFGVLLISTSQGIMTNQEAKKRKIGGRLLAYCY